jgi:predicted RNA-binding Zn ribbon-like protein
MEVEPMPPDVLVRLVNEWGAVPRAAAGEDQSPYPDPGPLTSQALRQAADHLHRVFAAADLAERVNLVTQLLAETGVRPALDLTPAATWLVEDPEHALLAAAALTLRHQLAEHDPARIGTCSGRRCADAFIDASPAGQRRFCSVTCQNRARIAAWRQSHRPSQP